MSPFLVIQTVFFSELSLGLTINKNSLMKKSVHVAGLTSITVNECLLEGSNANAYKMLKIFNDTF